MLAMIAACIGAVSSGALAHCLEDSLCERKCTVNGVELYCEGIQDEGAMCLFWCGGPRRSEVKEPS